MSSELSSTDSSEHLTRAITEYGESRPVIAKQAIFNAQGVKILDKGASIHAGLYERLTAHKLSQPIEESVTADGLVDGQALVNGIESALNAEPFYARLAKTPQARARLLDVIEKIPLPEPVAFQLTVARNIRPMLYSHALRTAWTMAALAHDEHGTQFDIGMSAAAGLLHDLGMLHLNPVLLDHKVELTRELRRELYSHPLVSTLLIERHHVYPKEVVNAVREHHEYRNGSGYPRNLHSPQISRMGQLLALTDLVVAMISGAHQGGEMRLGVLLRMNMHRYAKDLIEKILAHLHSETDPRSEHIPSLQHPTQVLCEVHETLQAWPRDCSRFANITPARRESMATVTALMDELRRTLAEAGLNPAQLEQLGSTAEDPLVAKELSLLAREAVWQLRMLARQVRRRWANGRQEQYPQEIQSWSARADALSLDTNGESAAQEPLYTRTNH